MLSIDRFQFRAAIAASALFAIAAVSTRVAHANEDVRFQLSSIAENVSKLVKDKGFDSIAIGQITGPPSFPTNAGPLVVKLLTEEFDKHGVSVKKRASLGLKGEYVMADSGGINEGPKFLAVQLHGSVVDNFGKIIVDFNLGSIKQGEFTTLLDGEKTLVDFLGPSVVIPPNEGSEGRNKRLRDAIEHPSTYIQDGTRVFASRQSPYGIEILVNGKPRRVDDEEGLPYVRLEKNDVYQIRLINNSPYHAAGRVTVDGLSVFAFSEAKHKDEWRKNEPLYTNYIAKPKGSVTIKGWHRNLNFVDSFRITDYAESAAAIMNQTASVGTISCSFSAAWDPNADPPPDEPQKFASIGSAAPDTGTGFGPRVQQKTKVVKKETGVVRAVVSIRYSKDVDVAADTSK